MSKFKIIKPDHETRKWYKFLCSKDAYEKCVKIDQKMHRCEWREFQKRIVTEIQLKYIKEEIIEDYPWAYHYHFIGFARTEKRDRFDRYYPSCGVSGIPDANRSSYVKDFRNVNKEGREKNQLRIRKLEAEKIEKYWEDKIEESKKARKLEFDKRTKEANEKQRLYALKRKNQLAADQFFIFSAAAQQISDIQITK